MKIIKLVYIAYGWYLALRNGVELVNEKPQAWDLGPVMPSLYHKLKKFGGNKVSEAIQVYNQNEEIASEDSYFLDFIWKKYGSYSGIQLSAITHTKGTPWSETYPKGANLEIPKSLIQSHYQAKLTELETAE